MTVPHWDSHSYPAVCLSHTNHWFGLTQLGKPTYHIDWKEKIVDLSTDRAVWLGKNTDPLPNDIEEHYYERP